MVDSSVFASHLWASWILLAIICGILEITVPYFTFILVSLAALVAAVVSLQAPLGVQLVSFGVVLVVTLFFIRPLLLKRFQKESKMVSRSQTLVGLEGELTEGIDPALGLGRVMVAGHDWAARSSHPIGKGKKVRISGHDGIVLIVEET